MLWGRAGDGVEKLASHRVARKRAMESAGDMIYRAYEPRRASRAAGLSMRSRASRANLRTPALPSRRE